MNIYVIAAGRRHVKIGISKDVEKRLRGIQTGCPYSVRLVKAWNTTRAREIERKAHQILARYRWAGEWFDLPTQAAVLAVELLVQAHPCRSGNDKSISRAVAFCRGCGHSAALDCIPDQAAKLRCTKCDAVNKVQVVDIANSAKSQSESGFLRS
ncbi:MAG: GIY-YIG nuclease family protein [Nitrobacter sp.]